MAGPRTKHSQSIRLPGILLDLAAIGASPAEKLSWVQIARTGRWRGYRAGPIEFTDDYFRILQTNLRNNPSYHKGADGFGDADVVPYDFDHGSEDGSPSQVEGDPAASWITDVDLRAGANGGPTELWALTRFLEPARTYILGGRYKWTSVGIWPNAIDPVTAKDLGPMLTSVAFTNKPFITGMQPIQIAASMFYCDKADNAEDALTQIRGLLGLPQLTDVVTVQAEIGKLRAWLAAGSLPPGVDGDDLLSGLRTILGCPVLASADEIFAELAKLVPALAEQQSLESSESANLPNAGGAPTMASTEIAMTPKMRLLLTRTLNLAQEASEDAILMGLEKLFLAAEEKAKEGADAKTKLGALLKAMGVEDSDGAIGKLTEMMKKCADLEAAMPELAQLKAEKEEAKKKGEESDVESAIAAHNLPPQMKDALLLLRRSDAVKFSAQFPVICANERHLTTQLFATQNGAPIGSQASGAGGSGERVLANQSRGVGSRVMLSSTVGVTLADIETAEGRNITEKAMSVIKMNAPGGANLSFDALHETAGKLLQQLRAS